MKINVVFALPTVSQAYGDNGLPWDGFIAAMNIIGKHHEVHWLNVHPYNGNWREEESRIPDADFVLVRSDWLWFPVQSADRMLWNRPDIPVGLLIAGSTIPPSMVQARRFDVLFYETPWYGQYVAEHPFAVQAFGIDTSIMKNMNFAVRPIDWLFVGRLAKFKRPERLLEKTGRRVAVGDFSSAPGGLLSDLSDAGVELLSHVNYEHLAQMYNSSRNVLVPCELQGGGERAVLEARACGCNVQISNDNPKLESLLHIKVPTHEEYAGEVLSAIEEVRAGRVVDSRVKVTAQKIRRLCFYVDKFARLRSTLRIRFQNIFRMGLSKLG